MTAQKKFKLDPNFINPFIIATGDVLTTMAGIQQVNKKKVCLKEDGPMFGDVSGIMGIAGKITGSIAICFPEEMSYQLVANMLGMERSEITEEDMVDGIGEILNIVCGNTKKLLSDTEYSFSISLPRVVTGGGHQIYSKKDIFHIQIVFEADNQEFAMEISFKNSEE